MSTSGPVRIGGTQEKRGVHSCEGESGLVHLPSSKNGLMVDRPVDDAEFLFLLEPEGREGDDLGRLIRAH